MGLSEMRMDAQWGHLLFSRVMNADAWMDVRGHERTLLRHNVGSGVIPCQVHFPFNADGCIAVGLDWLTRALVSLRVCARPTLVKREIAAQHQDGPAQTAPVDTVSKNNPHSLNVQNKPLSASL